MTTVNPSAHMREGELVTLPDRQPGWASGPLVDDHQQQLTAWLELERQPDRQRGGGVMGSVLTWAMVAADDEEEGDGECVGGSGSWSWW